MTRIRAIRQKYRTVSGSLDERSRRIWAVTEARALGYGGASLVSRATEISRSTIVRGMREARSGMSPDGDRIRRPGAGRKRATTIDRDLLAALDRLVDPENHDDPDPALRWTCKSARCLATELTASGHPASDWLVRHLLRDLGYGLHPHRTVSQGGRHPDRDAQFRHLHARVQHQLRLRQPAIWVDIKKEERGAARSRGWVSVGVDNDDTASFGVNTMFRWWEEIGSKLRPRARSLLIVTGCSGNDGNRDRLWKWELQRLADATRLTVHVCHLPRGTHKWNAIEQSLCSFSVRKRGRRRLPAHAAIVSLILGGRASTGRRSRCIRDRRRYPLEGRAAEPRMAAIRLTPNPFHGDWNYTVRPHGARATSGTRVGSAARGPGNRTDSRS